jgi:hypothetical protein
VVGDRAPVSGGRSTQPAGPPAQEHQVPADPQPPTAEQAPQIIATLLLAQAVHVSHAIERLRHLAAYIPDRDLTARADVADAIAIMITVRASLIHNADQLTNP